MRLPYIVVDTIDEERTILIPRLREYLCLRRGIVYFTLERVRLLSDAAPDSAEILWRGI